MDSLALLLLESPWWLPKDNPTRASVLPFFQGLERLDDRFNIYHSTFYDTAGFQTALAADLVHTIERRQILYIGAHGNLGSIAAGRASALLNKVGALERSRIEGVIVSSCLVGAREENLIGVFEGGVTRWVFAYTRSVNWLSSMLIELSLLEAILWAESDYACDQDLVLAMFAQALSRFNPAMPFGSESESLIDCITLLHRAKHKHKPENLTDALISITWSEE